MLRGSVPNQNTGGRVIGGASGHHRQHQWFPCCVVATLSHFVFLLLFLAMLIFCLINNHHVIYTIVASHEATDALYRAMCLAPNLPGGMVVEIAVDSITFYYIALDNFI